MTSPALESLRREIGKARDRLAFFNRDEVVVLEAVETLTRELAEAQGRVTEIAGSKATVVDLIQKLEMAAQALAAVPTPAAIPGVLVESEPTLPQGQQDDPDIERSRAAQRYVIDRAEALDMTQVTDLTFERADLVAMILVDHGPLRQYEIAGFVQESGLVDRKKHYQRVGNDKEFFPRIVSDALPVLVRQGRVRPVDHGEVRYVAWDATPAERASAGVGTDVDAYAGTTTRWPSDSDKPATGSRISIETSAFEGGKDR